jgi:hypothetical protein
VLLRIIRNPLTGTVPEANSLRVGLVKAAIELLVAAKLGRHDHIGFAPIPPRCDRHSFGADRYVLAIGVRQNLNYVPLEVDV